MKTRTTARSHGKIRQKRPAKRSGKRENADPKELMKVMADALLDSFLRQAIHLVSNCREECERQVGAINLKVGAVARAAASVQDRHTLANVFDRLKTLEAWMDKQTGGNGCVPIGGGGVV